MLLKMGGGSQAAAGHLRRSPAATALGGRRVRLRRPPSVAAAFGGRLRRPAFGCLCLLRFVHFRRFVEFFNAGSGVITAEYKAALEVHGLRSFQGDSAAVQPGKLSDLLLHETAVAWIREKLGRTLPARPWEESSKQLVTRLKRIAAHINKEHDVAGLCMGLPARVELLRQRGGGKLKK